MHYNIKLEMISGREFSNIVYKKYRYGKRSKDIFNIAPAIKKILLKIFTYVIHDMGDFFPDTTFVLSIEDTPQPSFARTSSRYNHCIIRFPISDFLNLCEQFLEKRRFSTEYQKIFYHELGHFKHFISSPVLRGFHIFKKYYPKSDLLDYFILKILSEGIAMLNEYQFSDFIQIRPITYNNARIELYRVAENFNISNPEAYYNQYLRYKPHDIGLLMCFTICLSEYKNAGATKVQIRGGASFPINNLDFLFSTENQVANAPRNIIQNTIKKLHVMDQKNFIKFYEKSCKNLGITKRHMTMWHGLIKSMRKNIEKKIS